MAHQFQLIFNCTLAQLETALITTLPAVGWVVTRAPIKYRGWIVGGAGGTGAANGLGQIDWEYDGQYFLQFFGANIVPTAQQAQAGIPQHNLLPAAITELSSALLATLGAPVPPNLAVPPAYVP